MEMEAIIRSIRTDLRLSMNGVVAASMREKGVHYRMNFGVDLMRIREIAGKYTPDAMLAEQLWGEDVRELKILATLLYPVDLFAKETAGRWGEEIANQEIREQACRNLFQKTMFAGELVNQWRGNVQEQVRTTAYWLCARLCITHAGALDTVETNLLLTDVTRDLKNGSFLLRQAALNVLKYYGRLSEGNRRDVLRRVSSFEDSSDPLEREVFDQLRFEFGMAD